MMADGDDWGDGDAREDEDDKVATWTPLFATGRADDIYTDGEAISRAEIAEAEQIRDRIGMPHNYESALLARFLRTARGPAPGSRPDPNRPGSPIPFFAQKERLKKIVGRLVGMVRTRFNDKFDYEDIYVTLMKRDGVPQKLATVDQLKERICYLERWLEEPLHAR